MSRTKKVVIALLAAMTLGGVVRTGRIGGSGLQAGSEREPAARLQAWQLLVGHDARHHWSDSTSTGVSRTARHKQPINWAFIGVLGLSVEFWVVVGTLIAHYT